MAITFDHVACCREGPDLKPSVGLDDLHLTIREGQFVAVLGAPGSGKTTLLQHLNGLLRPDTGAVEVMGFRLEGGMDSTAASGGDDCGRRRRRGRKGKTVAPLGLRRRVGLVFQFPEQQLFEETVERDLRFGPLNFGFGQTAAAEAARKAAREAGLDEELLGRSPFALSGGQMRKAAIAAVLAADPDVLALDEPASSLDQASREELMRLLHEWRRERGKTVVIVTHRLEEVLPYADEYVVLDAGKCIFQGDAAELLGQPQVLARAGADVPDSAALLAEVAAAFAAEAPTPGLDPDSAASWIQQLLDSADGSPQPCRR